MDEKNWGDWGFAFAATLLCFLAALAWIVCPAVDLRDARLLPWWLKSVTLLAVVATVVWFVRSFTGDPAGRRPCAVIFAYFFVFASFAILCIPPFVLKGSAGSEPLGIVSGCVLPRDSKLDLDELSCDREAVLARQRTQSESGAKAPPKVETAAPRPEVTPDKKATEPSAQGAERKLNFQWIVNIGGAIREVECDCQNCAAATGAKTCPPGTDGVRRYAVSGGFVVPLHFVIIALFGAAISLSRRVPEIQKRAEENFPGTAVEPRLQAGEARELLAFQIMQYASAPLIAITAYQVIRPESPASSAALAFMCGFGSETVLLMIRGAFTGIKPQSVTIISSKSGTIAGTITDAAGKPIQGATVSLVSNAAATTKTDAFGSYVLEGVSACDQKIRVERTDVSPAVAKVVEVRVEPDKRTTCNVQVPA